MNVSVFLEYYAERAVDIRYMLQGSRVVGRHVDHINIT